MRLDGRPVHFRSARDALAAGIGMVHQELSIVPSLERGRERVPRPPADQRRRRRALAGDGARGQGASAAAGHRRRPRGRDAAGCRSGLQQLVELGRVLFSGARIIILDEPTSALSPPEIERLFAVLRRLKARGHQLHLHLPLPRGRARGLGPGDGVPEQPAHRHRRRGRGRQALADRADDRPRPPGARGGARGRGGAGQRPRPAPVVLEAHAVWAARAPSPTSRFTVRAGRGAGALRLHGLGPARDRQGADGQAGAGARVDHASTASR